MRAPGTYDPLRPDRDEQAAEAPSPPPDYPSLRREHSDPAQEPERPPLERINPQPEPNKLGLGDGHDSPSHPRAADLEANRGYQAEIEEMRAKMQASDPFKGKTPDERQAEIEARTAARQQQELEDPHKKPPER